ncbi:MAG: hypothetical protein ACRCUS_09050, partial [Anaerovoracaceae bacterium]
IVPEGKALNGILAEVGEKGSVICDGEINVFRITGEEGAKLVTGEGARVLMFSNFYIKGKEEAKRPETYSEYIGKNGNWIREDKTEAEEIAFRINNQPSGKMAAATAIEEKVVLHKNVELTKFKLNSKVKLELLENTILTVGKQGKSGELILEDKTEILGTGLIKLAFDSHAIQDSGKPNERIVADGVASYRILTGEKKGEYYFNQEKKNWEIQSSSEAAKVLAKKLNLISAGSAKSEGNRVILLKAMTLSKEVQINEEVELNLNGKSLTVQATLCNKGEISGNGDIIVASKYSKTFAMLYNAGSIEIDGKLVGKISGANFENTGTLKLNNISEFVDSHGEGITDYKGNFFWKTVSADGKGFWSRDY